MHLEYPAIYVINVFRLKIVAKIQTRWKLLKQMVLLQDKTRAEESFGSLRKEKKTRFQVEENRRAQAQWHADIRMPRLPVSEEHRDRDILMINLWNRFRAAPDSVAYCSG